MLTHLSIENFAIIEKCSLDFNAGMTVITGETGAGKSIILDALSLVLGARAESQPIREGAQKCEIHAVFDLSLLQSVQQWIKEKELEGDSDECFLRRSFLPEGRSRSFINHHPVSLQLLRELGELLVTLHGQHEHQALLSRDTHREWVDIYGHHETLLKQLQGIYLNYKETEKKLNASQSLISDKDSKEEFLNFQLAELKQFGIDTYTPEKIQQLEHEFKLLSSMKNHAENYHAILNLVDNTLLPSIHKIQQLLPTSDNKTFHEYFNSAEIQFQQAVHDIHQLTDNSELNLEKINTLEKQLDTLFHLARKHHVKPEELCAQYNKLQEDLIQIKTLSENIASLKSSLEGLKQQYLTVGKKLSQSREKTAKKMSAEVEQHLKQLNMEHAKFIISLVSHEDHTVLHSHGLEKVEFLVSANPGQPAGPLVKIASGGELSRISLAIDLVASKDQILPVLIFDEVDAGISGAAALKVAKLLKTLSQKAQVICITHLAQIASKADHHLTVEKTIDIKRNKTLSDIQYLNKEERIHTIAKLIGGDSLTKKALSHARELVDSK